jgi:methylated-DNA-protein-cysteine methyltransferase-like protein
VQSAVNLVAVATDFSLKVIQTLQKIPRGRVATYGQIAALAGKPHAARGVSWILSSSSTAHRLPWHRVLNSKGEIAFPWTSRHFVKQKKYLEAEGVEVTEPNRVDLKKYQWKKKPAASKSRGAGW